MQPRAPARVQARHQACALPQAYRGVCWHPQGGVLQVQEEPQESPEACCEEVVLYAYCRVWPRLSNKMHRQVEGTILWQPKLKSFRFCSPQKSNMHCHLPVRESKATKGLVVYKALVQFWWKLVPHNLQKLKKCPPKQKQGIILGKFWHISAAINFPTLLLFTYTSFIRHFSSSCHFPWWDNRKFLWTIKCLLWVIHTQNKCLWKSWS